MGNLTPDEALQQDPVCKSLIYRPTVPELDPAYTNFSPISEPDGGQLPTFEGGVAPVDPNSGLESVPTTVPSQP